MSPLHSTQYPFRNNIHYDHFNPPGPPCELFKADITTQTRSHSHQLFSDAITPPLSPPRDAPLFPTHWLTFLLIRKHPPGPACCVTSPFSNSRQLSVSDEQQLAVWQQRECPAGCCSPTGSPHICLSRAPHRSCCPKAPTCTHCALNPPSLEKGSTSYGIKTSFQF